MQKDWNCYFLLLGVFISIFSPVALITDLLALKGLRQWRRGLMIPWLILYGILIALAFAVAITELYHRGIRWPLLLLAFCSLLVFSRWRHLSLQYKVKLSYVYIYPCTYISVASNWKYITLVSSHCSSWEYILKSHQIETLINWPMISGWLRSLNYERKGIQIPGPCVIVLTDFQLRESYPQNTRTWINLQNTTSKCF